MATVKIIECDAKVRGKDQYRELEDCLKRLGFPSIPQGRVILIHEKGKGGVRKKKK
jgi:hypothetical protein